MSRLVPAESLTPSNTGGLSPRGELMIRVRVLCAVLFACVSAACIEAQAAAPAPVPNPVLTKRPAPAITSDASPVVTPTIPLAVSKGTPVQVALDDEIRVRSAGQSIKGHVVEPVYAFDKLMIPVGTIAIGQIKKIEDLPAGKRTLAAMDADFTPVHEIQVEFNELVLPDGKHIPVRTSFTPGSGQSMNF